LAFSSCIFIRSLFFSVGKIFELVVPFSVTPFPPQPRAPPLLLVPRAPFPPCVFPSRNVLPIVTELAFSFAYRMLLLLILPMVSPPLSPSLTPLSPHLPSPVMPAAGYRVGSFFHCYNFVSLRVGFFDLGPKLPLLALIVRKCCLGFHFSFSHRCGHLNLKLPGKCNGDGWGVW